MNNKNTNQKTTETISIEDIFSENRFFRIPDYQRGYSWEDKQVRDLISDIENLHEKYYVHFTGTIVAASNGPDSNMSKSVYDIVDGQQRLTSILILLKCIYNIDNQKYNFILSKYLQSGPEGNQILIFTPNKETLEYFYELIIKDNNKIIPKIKSHFNIIHAKREFDKWLNKNKNRIDDILKIITRRLGFIFYTPENDKEIGIMFEVINNRGKELSELEKIKNYFIYFSTLFDLNELKNEVNSKWYNILVNLSNANKTDTDEENKFIRYCYLVFYEANKERSWNVYNSLKLKYSVKNINKEEILNMHREIIAFVNFLNNASLYYSYFYNENIFESFYNGKFKKEISKILKYLRCQPVNASIMPLYLSLTVQVTEENNLYEILEILEILNFRIYVLPKVTNRSDSKQGELFKWANYFYNNKLIDDKDYSDLEGDAFNRLKSVLIQFTKKLCSEEDIIKKLTLEKDEKEDFKDWEGIRYILARYEEELRKLDKTNWDVEKILIKRADNGEYTNDYLSVEHIWARENMREEFNENIIEKRRLGNFMLLMLAKNISLGYLSIPDKVKKMNELIDEGKIFDLSQVSQFKNAIYKEALKFTEKINPVRKKNFYKNLSKKICDIRETELITFTLKTWTFPDENRELLKEINSFSESAQPYKLNNP